MAIQDSDPERRNLVVMSLGFIIFYLGEGVMVSDQLALPLVNIEFKNTTFLAWTAWIMLFWFLWRYWLTHQGDAEKEFTRELYDLVGQKFLDNYVAHKTSSVLDGNGGFSRVKRTPRESKDVYPRTLIYTELRKTAEGDDGQEIEVRGGMPEKSINFEGWSLLRADFKFVLFTAMKKPAFTSYIVPYLLFLAAVFIGAWDCGLEYFGSDPQLDASQKE